MNRNTIRRSLAIYATLVALSPVAASAHTGHGTSFSALEGLTHPLGGADHLAAMISVGLWAALVGGRRLWLWPAMFVAAMIFGAAVARAGIALPAVEATIATSVVVLGLLVAGGVSVSTALGAALIAVFAVAHGHAHGAEAPAGGWFGYVAGFAAATAALHGVGILIGTGLKRFATSLPSRAAGAGIAALGLALLIR